MPADLRSHFSAALGHDLSHVRVYHSETVAGAWASSGDVVLGPGAWQPERTAGLRLLAHELAHVAQVDRGQAPAGVAHGLVNYLRQLPPDEAQPFLARFDTTVGTLATEAATAEPSLRADMEAAVERLRALRTASRVTCWETSGGLNYASYDNASGEVRLHTNFGNVATSPSTLLHEGIHAAHAHRYPAMSRAYARGLAAGGVTGPAGIDLLRWKAWTEYWAYRRQYEATQHRYPDAPVIFSAHENAVREDDVRSAIRAVERETGTTFEPWTWTPPARPGVRPAGGRRR